MNQDAIAAHFRALGWQVETDKYGITLKQKRENHTFIRSLSWQKAETEMIPRQRGMPVPTYLGDPNRYGNGKSKWVEHTPGMNEVCVQDMASSHMRDQWPGYQVIKDDRGNVIAEGPKPFTSRKEMLDYCEAAGYTLGNVSDSPVEYRGNPKYTPGYWGMTPEDALDPLDDE